jgi:hypothetical protein
MQLKLKRSQRSGGMMGGKIFFQLDARVDLSPDEQALVKKYNLGKTVVYDSEARKKHAETAGAHFDYAVGNSGSTLSAVGRGVWANARGLASVAMAALSLRVTVDSLVNGQHIECKDMDELLGAEGACREACRNIKSYLDVAESFDGREEIVEF